MKVFLSSVISGFEPYREAAARGITTLRHELIRAEDFGASPGTPQQVCLDGVRRSDVVVLVLGERYGYVAPSGLSATHEEYREARDTKDLLVFVQQGIKPEPNQKKFIDEVSAWASGRYLGKFTTPDELHGAVIEALHRLEMSRATGQADEVEMLARARQKVPTYQDTHDRLLWLSVAGGPRQQVLRPAELESPELARDLKRMLLFDDDPFFSTEHGISERFEEDTLVFRQNKSSVSLDEMGTICVVQAARKDVDWRSGEAPNVVIKEEILDRIARGLRLAGKVLEKIDPTGKITDVVPIVTLFGAEYTEWKTLAQHRASPNTASMAPVSDRIEVTLSPGRRNRAALTVDTVRLAEDLTIRLSRNWRRP